MPLEKPYLQQINLDGDGKFAKSLIFCSFAVVQKELHPKFMAPNVFICDSMRPRIIAAGKLPSKADLSGFRLGE